VLIAAFSGAVVSLSAQAQTIATFADPASSPATPLFSLNAATGVFTGGWAGTGLTLLTPGYIVPVWNDVTFVLSPLSTTASFGPVRTLSGGNVRFFDSSSQEIFRIDFSDSLLTSSLSLGSSDFVGSNVTFSGLILSNLLSVSDEAFAFSFANPVSAPPAGSFTVTSSFTSSATVIIPTPGSAALAGMAGLVLLRRRR
jgi:uncharacterized protein (TIGR03382 family)